MTTPVLETQALVKQFGSVTAVDQLSLSVPADQRHAIIGPNGSGKTTLFDLVTGAVRPDQGRIQFHGQDITTASEDARAREGIVRSFQLTNLFGGLSVQENLQLAVQATEQTFNPFRLPDTAIVERASEWYGALELDADPQAPVETISHGDRNRLEVGTALATDADLLLLDEPTSGVPPEESRALLRLIEQMTTGQTVLLIEHDMDVALSFADQVTVLDRGSVITQNTPEQIVNDTAVQNAYLRGYGDTTLD
ncbi:MAG: ABC-type branched-chain amino acid transport system, ATPase component [halophilic archaeon J07HX5]|nr:MAG: ABC-type branched-chain amino acid transport system, ATPase component [halophilic archaeon J07HX5]